MLVLIFLLLDQLLCVGFEPPWWLALALLPALPGLGLLDWRMVRNQSGRRLLRGFYLIFWIYLSLALFPWPQSGLPQPEVVIDKRHRHLYFRGTVLRIALSRSWSGTKLQAGDGRTPEGRYRICSKAPDGPFGYWLGLDYPNRQDAWGGRQAGRVSWLELTRWAWFWRQEPPQNTGLGGQVGLHGGGTRHDWTLGCIALSDQDIKYLYEHIEIGTVVEIY